MNDEERDLRRLFQELKAEDIHSAPPFQDVRRSAAHSNFAIRSAAAIVFLGALGLALFLSRGLIDPQKAGSADQITMQTVAEISQWKSPTDFLLKTPGDSLLTTVPHFGNDVLNGKFVLEQTNSESE